eukprot:scaffold63955_cov28-Tisochrysis_lutea.AAC.2
MAGRRASVRRRGGRREQQRRLVQPHSKRSFSLPSPRLAEPLVPSSPLGRVPQAHNRRGERRRRF